MFTAGVLSVRLDQNRIWLSSFLCKLNLFIQNKQLMINILLMKVRELNVFSWREEENHFTISETLVSKCISSSCCLVVDFLLGCPGAGGGGQ